jgi:hypothetical protein
MTSLFWVVLVQAQDLDNSDKHAFEIKRNVALNGSGATQTVKFGFAREWNPRTTPVKGTYSTTGFYNFWINCTTTAGGTDSLRMVVYPLNYEGSLGDQDSTVSASYFDWTSATEHGPFNFEIDNVAGYAIKLKNEGVSADTCTCVLTGYK